MSEGKSLELRVSVDVGYRRHSVAIGLPNGKVLEEFEITHRPEGFKEFFSRIDRYQREGGLPRGQARQSKQSSLTRLRPSRSVFLLPSILLLSR